MGRMKAVWGEDAMDFKPERYGFQRQEGLDMSLLTSSYR